MQVVKIHQSYDSAVTIVEKSDGRRVWYPCRKISVVVRKYKRLGWHRINRFGKTVYMERDAK